MITKQIIIDAAKPILKKRGMKTVTSYLPDYVIGAVNSGMEVVEITRPYPHPADYDVRDLRGNSLKELPQEGAALLLERLKKLPV